MSQIVPRWEWRIFGRDFGPAEAVFADLTPIGPPTDSEEIYFHHRGVGTIVKIRDDLLDVKVLKRSIPRGWSSGCPC